MEGLLVGWSLYPKTTGSRGLSPWSPVLDNGASRIAGTILEAALEDHGFRAFFAFAIKALTKIFAGAGLRMVHCVQSIYRLPVIASLVTWLGNTLGAIRTY
jgi:hypothetical protein